MRYSTRSIAMPLRPPSTKSRILNLRSRSSSLILCFFFENRFVLLLTTSSFIPSAFAFHKLIMASQTYSVLTVCLGYVGLPREPLTDGQQVRILITAPKVIPVRTDCVLLISALNELAMLYRFTHVLPS